MDLHVITSRGAVLVAQVIDGQLLMPPPDPQEPDEPAPLDP